MDELSILKTIECILPKNVFLTIDYNIKKDDETDELKADSELSDYIEEESAVIKENGAIQRIYSELYNKCYIKDDGSAAIMILSDCLKNDDNDCIKNLHNPDSNSPLPFLYERLDFSDYTEKNIQRGWNFGNSFGYKTIFKEKNVIQGIEVNIPIPTQDYFYLAADMNLWSENKELIEWNRWLPISFKKYYKFRTDAEKNLAIRLEKKNKNKEKKRSKKENNKKTSTSKNDNSKEDRKNK